ncbi:sulfite exporter TauE/SafE family protein [Tsuneonella suprasediminis]|uniref:Probable membrane transporter protein n=1 Tax=Tsuneonella suprasediminis TaxID=2306996 RepID=A0A419R5R2_9SPHN|nr:sulfite exporter TauE/SafE family protein [Tsuneonella suprasediminis]RJX71225.1 sulfite exporter TauE/SafE family protein [Tsuneonella suprasediminis]
MIDLAHAMAGLLVGVLVGLTGVGGGSLMTPLLVLMFGVAPQTAVGTDLLFAAVTKTVGVGVHHGRQTIDWKIVRRLAIGSIPAALLTLMALNTFGQLGKNTSHMVLIVLGVLLLITSVGLLFQRRLMTYGATHQFAHSTHSFAPTVALGAVLGLLVTITSVGAGAIGATILLLLYRRIPVARIVGSDIAHAVPLALIAGAGHWLLGSVDFALLLTLLIGSIPGVIAGSLLSSHAPERLLQLVLAAILAVSGVRLLMS